MGAAILKECDMDYARKLLDFGLEKTISRYSITIGLLANMLQRVKTLT